MNLHTIMGLTSQLGIEINTIIRDKLTRYLSREKELKGTDRMRLPMSKKALAERIGVQRTSLSKELAHMKREA